MRKLVVSAMIAGCLAGIFAPVGASASTRSQPVGSSTIGNGSGQCLDAQGLSVGSAVDMAACDPSNPDQQWNVTSRGSFKLWGHDKFVSNGALGIDLSYQASELDFTYGNNHTLQDNASGDYLTWVPGSNPQPGLETQDGQTDQTWYIFTYLGVGHKMRAVGISRNLCTEVSSGTVNQSAGTAAVWWRQNTSNCGFYIRVRIACFSRFGGGVNVYGGYVRNLFPVQSGQHCPSSHSQLQEVWQQVKFTANGSKVSCERFPTDKCSSSNTVTTDAAVKRVHVLTSGLCEVSGQYCVGGSASNGDQVTETIDGRQFTTTKTGNQYEDRHGNFYNEYTIEASTGQCVAVTNDGEAATYRDCTSQYAIMYKIPNPNGPGFYFGNQFASNQENGNDYVLCGSNILNAQFLYEPQPFFGCYEALNYF